MHVVPLLRGHLRRHGMEGSSAFLLRAVVDCRNGGILISGSAYAEVVFRHSMRLWLDGNRNGAICALDAGVDMACGAKPLKDFHHHVLEVHTHIHLERLNRQGRQLRRTFTRAKKIRAEDVRNTTAPP